MSGGPSLDWLQSQGGDARAELEQAEQQNELMMAAAKEEARQTARLFYEVLGTGRGPELMELLRAHTLELSLMNMSLTIGNDRREIGCGPSEWAFLREGQNTITVWFERMIREAKRAETEESENV